MQEKLYGGVVDPLPGRRYTEIPSCPPRRRSSRYGTANVVDVVLLNGDFVYGTDTREAQERSFEAVRGLLRPGGWLLIGWNMDADGRPFVMKPRAGRTILPPPELSSVAGHFDHEGPPGLPRHVDFADCPHVYDWFRLRDARREKAAGD